MNQVQVLSCAPEIPRGRSAAGDTGPWVIILAAGEGSRLASLTRGPDGVPVPKQFCSFDGRRSLLRATLDRAGRLAPPARQVVVVAAHHERWWRGEVAGLPPGNVLVQPFPRGTAAGLLLPALECQHRDPQAAVAVLPSDHHVEDEQVLQAALRDALTDSRRHAGCPVLLGIQPDRPDCGYGWIVPEAAPDRGSGIARFVEKPEGARATALMEAGAVWSSFMLCGAASALLQLFDRAMPGPARLIGETWSGSGQSGAGGFDEGLLQAAYRRIPALDFSRDVLEACADRVRVVSVPACGWTDLGTPERVAGCAGLAGPIVDRARALARAEERAMPQPASVGSPRPPGREARSSALRSLPGAAT